MHSSKISKKGQIVIPSEIRAKLKILPGDTLIITNVGNRIYIEKEDQSANTPPLVEILKQGKPFPTHLVKILRDEWE